MARKKNTYGLSIFLIKNEYRQIEDIVNLNKCGQRSIVEISGFDSAVLCVKKNKRSLPKWAKLFESSLDTANIIGNTQSVCALLVVKRHGQFYSLAFGQGGRFLLKDNVAEERFGLIVSLNSISKESLRCVDKQSLDSIESQSRTQSSYPTSASQFGIDVEQDMLKAVIGIPLNPSLGSRIGGTDSLSVSVKLDLSDLPDLITQYMKCTP